MYLQLNAKYSIELKTGQKIGYFSARFQIHANLAKCELSQRLLKRKLTPIICILRFFAFVFDLCFYFFFHWQRVSKNVQLNVGAVSGRQLLLLLLAFLF